MWSTDTIEEWSGSSDSVVPSKLRAGIFTSLFMD